jgi:hypothetical protein
MHGLQTLAVYAARVKSPEVPTPDAPF